MFLTAEVIFFYFYIKAEEKREEKRRKKMNQLNHFFLASRKFCRLIITFSNSLDPDQDWQNVSPDLEPNCLTLCLCS